MGCKGSGSVRTVCLGCITHAQHALDHHHRRLTTQSRFSRSAIQPLQIKPTSFLASSTEVQTDDLPPAEYGDGKHCRVYNLSSARSLSDRTRNPGPFIFFFLSWIMKGLLHTYKEWNMFPCTVKHLLLVVQRIRHPCELDHGAGLITAGKKNNPHPHTIIAKCVACVLVRYVH